MIRIITKEDQSILFNKEEIKFSTFLNNMFFNKQFYNNEDSEDSCEDSDNSCEDSDNKNVKELKIDKLSIQSLVKIKAIIQYVLEKKIENDYKNNNKIKKMIQISKYFSLKEFFELLDVVNYLHIELIINVMVNYINLEIEDNTLIEIKKTFNLTDDDFTGAELIRIELFNKIICD